MQYLGIFALDTSKNGGPGDIPIPCTMEYDPSQPFEVNFTFHIAKGDNTWTFGRDILIDGLIQRAGEGDVQAWVDGEKFHMLFKSPEGQANVWTSTDLIEEFVRGIVLMVPIGEESYDLDRELQAFLEG